MLKQDSHPGVHFKAFRARPRFSGLYFLLLLILCVFIAKINKRMKCRQEVMGKGLLQGAPP